MDVFVVENLEKKFFFTTSYQAFVMFNIIVCSREAWPHSSHNRPGSVEGTFMARSVGWSSTSPPFPTSPSHPPLSSEVILPSPPESSFPLLWSHPPHSFRIILPTAGGHPFHSSRVIFPTPRGSSFPLLWGHPSRSSRVILPTPRVILPSPPQSA